MHRRAVIALAEVVEDELPVRVDLIDLAMRGFQLVGLAMRELADERRQRVGERLRVAREIDEDEALPDFERDRMQRIVARPEASDIRHRRHRAKRTVEAVRPRMIRALDRSAERAGCLAAQPAAAMAA